MVSCCVPLDARLTVLDPGAAELAKELDGLPLALATAGAYLNQVTTSFADYLRLYKASWLKLQQTSPKVSSYEDRQLYSTWQLSLDHIREQNELSAKLLRLWAYFDNQDLWFELLQEGRKGGPEWLCEVTEDELSFNQAVRVLCDHGLVEVDKSSKESGAESEGYEMHSCVHSWTVHVLNQEWDSETAGLALLCVGLHAPFRDALNQWFIQQRLMRHASRCWEFVTNGRLDDDGRDWIFFKFGYMYLDQERPAEAEKMYLRALQLRENVLGLEHQLTLSTVNNLGVVYLHLDRLDEAEKMYLRALQGYEKALDPETVSTHIPALNTINNLGVLYKGLGRLNEAEKMYQRALHGYEKALDPEDGIAYIPALNTINNLGTIYAELGRLGEAEEMHLRALVGYEKACGLDHPSTLNTVQNLGLLYWDLGRPDKAEKMYLRALAGHKKIWGPEHTSTLNTIHNLASLYISQGRIEEAKKMYLQAPTTMKD